jgi:hypothetical protein
MICKIAAPAFSGLAMTIITNHYKKSSSGSLRGILSLSKETKQSLLVIARNPELAEGDEAISRKRLMPRYLQDCYAIILIMTIQVP